MCRLFFLRCKMPAIVHQSILCGKFFKQTYFPLSQNILVSNPNPAILAPLNGHNITLCPTLKRVELIFIQEHLLIVLEIEVKPIATFDLHISIEKD